MIVTMSNRKIDEKSYNKLLKLLKEFHQAQDLTGDDFIQKKLEYPQEIPLSEFEIAKLVLLVRHYKFLNAIKENFVVAYNLRNYHDVRIVMVIFLLLFALESLDEKDVCVLFKGIKCAFKRKLVQYFIKEDNLIQTALTGCKFFEDEYVLNCVIKPIVGRQELLDQIDKFLQEDKLIESAPKPVTVPQQFNLFQRRKIIPPVPLNTPAEWSTFHAKSVPISHYQQNNIEKKLCSEFEKNKMKAQLLLEKAKALDKNYCKVTNTPVVPIEKPPKFKASKVPNLGKKVEIKRNIAAVLREASVCVKEQEKEIKEIEDLMKGGASLAKFEELEESVRKQEEENHLQDIEKKHLLGLLTFEESILARRKLQEQNKERYREFVEERDKFLAKLQNWKDEEQEKIQESVRKCQQIERNAKESNRKIKQEKKQQVAELKNERKRVLEELYVNQQEDLAEKVRLIEEIKTMHQLKMLDNERKLDRSECPKLGLLCQMSLVDLEEKLEEMRMKMEEELEQRRRCIKKYRENQRNMIQNVKNFITQTRMSKPIRTVPIRTAKLTPPSHDLDRLRNQLEQAREQRRRK